MNIKTTSEQIALLKWLAQTTLQEVERLESVVSVKFNPVKPTARTKSEPNPARVFVYEALSGGKTMTIKQLFDLAKSKGMKVTKHTINARANELADSLHIERVGHGKYRRAA